MRFACSCFVCFATGTIRLPQYKRNMALTPAKGGDVRCGLFMSRQRCSSQAQAEQAFRLSSKRSKEEFSERWCHADATEWVVPLVPMAWRLACLGPRRPTVRTPLES